MGEDRCCHVKPCQDLAARLSSALLTAPAHHSNVLVCRQMLAAAQRSLGLGEDRCCCELALSKSNKTVQSASFVGSPACRQCQHAIRLVCRQMLAAAQRSLGVAEDRCCYELAVSNPDKGTLPKDVVQQRVQAFRDAKLPLVLTKASFCPVLQQQASLRHGKRFSR